MRKIPVLAIANAEHTSYNVSDGLVFPGMHIMQVGFVRPLHSAQKRRA